MKVSKKWLSEYLDLNGLDDNKLYDIITKHVCEIETMKKLVDATNLTVGKVLECEDIEGTHLHKCQVEVEKGHVEQIVCGAPNVKAGVLVIVANPGAILPGNFKIKQSKIRGVESNGMLCSLQELGVEEKYVPEEFKNGIYLFKEDIEIGSNPLEYLGLDDTIIDLEVTSNRSDLLSIEGVAYDLGAALNQQITTVIPDIEEIDKKNPVEVKIETDKCYKYLARYIAYVKIEESPMWLKSKLVASGIRPINNVVDITNLVLMEMGQPLHSFDADKLGNKIVIRNAYKDEKLVTLDNEERTLDENDIVITNGNDAVCVAGVMGGLSTEIENDSKNVILEAAYFDPLSIRKTSSKLNLKSESSMRFERKIDYDRVERALDYAAQLISEIAGGKIYSGVSKEIKKELELKTIDITVDKINSVLGTVLSSEYVEELFNRLNYSYVKNNNVYTITIPSRRMDLEESPQDIIEDVARMYGYDNIPTTLAKTRDKGGLTYRQKRIRTIRQILAYSGLNEIVSYSLIKEADLGLYVKDVKEAVKVLMPLTEDRAVMRQSLLNGLIDAIIYNKARKLENLSLFEIGNVYYKDCQRLHLAIALNGLFSSQLWRGVKNKSEFYLLKGLADSLFDKLNFKVQYKASSDIKSFHPGRCAEILHNGEVIGYLAEMHPKFESEHDCKNTVVLEIDLEAAVTETNKLKYHSINKFPSINRDLAIVVKNDVIASDIEECIKKAARNALTDIKLFDVYTGENVGEDEKSLAFSLTFEDYNKTLETQEVDELVNKILEKLAKEYNARLR